MEIKTIQDALAFLKEHQDVQQLLLQAVKNDRVQEVLKKYSISVDPALITKALTMLNNGNTDMLGSMAAGLLKNANAADLTGAAAGFLSALKK